MDPIASNFSYMGGKKRMQLLRVVTEVKQWIQLLKNVTEVKQRNLIAVNVNSSCNMNNL